MATIAELLKDDDLEALLPGVVEVAGEVESRRKRRGDKDTDSRFVPSGQWEDDVELSVPMLRYFHAVLLKSARREGGLSDPYTHSTTVNLSKVIQAALGIDFPQAGRLSHWVGVNLSQWRLARRKEPRSWTWYVRPWPRSLHINLVSSTPLKGNRALDLEVDRQNRRHPTDPVVAHHDLALIELPDPSRPDDFVVYIKTLKEAYDRLAGKFETEQRLRQEAEDREAEIRAELEAAATDEWAHARDRIAAIMVEEPDASGK